MGYEEIGDILNRHNTLTEANNDLMRHSAEVRMLMITVMMMMMMIIVMMIMIIIVMMIMMIIVMTMMNMIIKIINYHMYYNSWNLKLMNSVKDYKVLKQKNKINF